MEEDLATQLTTAFETVRNQHDENVKLRLRTAEVVAEAVMMARAAEHEASIYRARVEPRGSNAEERASNLLLELEDSEDYKSLIDEGVEHRRTSNSAQRSIEAMTDEIKMAQIQGQLLCNLASKIL